MASQEAIEEIQRALRAEPESAEAAYHAACVFSLLGESEEALVWLRTAVERGHQEFWWARVDSDLDYLRGQRRFNEIMADWETHLRTLFH